MVTPQERPCSFHPGGPGAEQQAAPLVLHSEHDNQQQDDGPLGSALVHVLGKPVIPDLRLHEMQKNAQCIDPESQHIETVQPPGVSRPLLLGGPDEPPDPNLVQQIT